MYVDALLGEWRDVGTIVARCDTNRTRMDYHVERIGHEVPRFAPGEFDKVLELADAVMESLLGILAGSVAASPATVRAGDEGTFPSVGFQCV
ncbi:hypothetical protein [Nonomuraea sp. B19D2]|uniref:hypothetical protein n=1 Tax=Nonomuraea sp. B19D2 TaxID=3159561 RepID=UPI0032DB4BB8